MSWPLSQDYNEAIQSPDSSFADPELRGGQPTTNAMGMPMPRSGNFADVYEFVGVSGAKWAVKCFTREIHGLQERYSEISKHLVQAKLPFTVDFKYAEKGIRIRGQWYPILKMQWVEGFLLNEFVRNNLDKPALLEGLGQIWLRMARRLRESDLAHADLQHGNVLLVPGSKASSLAVKLIDYDGMFVPALANKKSGEVGHPNYQHPQRLREGIYNAEVDRLPLLVVATALRALSVGGRELWERHDNGDNMLFRETDLKAPDQSALFKELHELPDPQVRALTRELHNALKRKLEVCPAIDELFPETKAAAARAAASPPTAVKQEEPPAAARSPLEFDEANSTEPKRTEKARRSGIPIWALVAGGGVLAALGVLITGITVIAMMFPGGDRNNGKAVAQGKADDNPAKDGKKLPKKDVGNSDKAKPPIIEVVNPGKEKKPIPEIRPSTWKNLAPMPTARSMLATVTGPDGRIYAIGGANASGRLDAVEAYDPSADTWAKVAPMPTARNHLAATIGPDNRIYVIGGHSSIPNIVEAYNPSTNKWTKVASTPTARHGLAAATGPDGHIYAIGGNGPGGSLKTVEAYDTKTNTWTTVATMPTARVYLAATTGPDGRIYAIGGFVEKGGKRLNTVEAYDTKTNTWTAVAPMPTARNVLAAVTGPDGRIYALGGHPDGGIGNIVETYNLSTNTWTTAANMPTVRGELAATTGRDGRIYVIGGGGNVPFLNTVEALSFSSGKP